MAQTQALTTQGFGEMGKRMGGEAATGIKSVIGLKTTCTVSAASTYAAPGGTKCTESGLTLADAATVVSSTTTAANDTVELDHVFTAWATVTVLGFMIANDDDDVEFGECCFNAGVAMESGDTLTVEFKIQFKAD